MEPVYHELSRATTTDEVVALTREWLSSWSREELERLPDSCRPGWVRRAEDIEHWADRLVLEGRRTVLFMDDERKLDRLTNHFLIASVRLRQIARCANPSPSPLAA